ncbi:MAG: shikimate kinase [Polyangiaceae bacterium]|nr:shikimate kinase [Polyangiaceae bacterium]
MNVVLVGYRGTGKSAVAGIIGEALVRPVISLDAELVRRAGSPIPELVSREGWSGFRDREVALVAELSARHGIVLDCGGGVVERRENFAPLRASGRVVWLRATPATIVQRIAADNQRPALTAGKSFTDEVVEVLARRAPLYSELANDVVDTDALCIESVAALVLDLVRPHLEQQSG